MAMQYYLPPWGRKLTNQHLRDILKLHGSHGREFWRSATEIAALVHKFPPCSLIEVELAFKSNKAPSPVSMPCKSVTLFYEAASEEHSYLFGSYIKSGLQKDDASRYDGSPVMNLFHGNHRTRSQTILHEAFHYLEEEFFERPSVLESWLGKEKSEIARLQWLELHKLAGTRLNEQVIVETAMSGQPIHIPIQQEMLPEFAALRKVLLKDVLTLASLVHFRREPPEIGKAHDRVLAGLYLTDPSECLARTYSAWLCREALSKNPSDAEVRLAASTYREVRAAHKFDGVRTYPNDDGLAKFGSKFRQVCRTCKM